MPSDAQRIDTIKYLISQGFEDKLLMSHDIHTIHRLVSLICFFVSWGNG